MMDVEKFINLIKSQPILYDRRHKSYQNFIKKAKIWEMIAREMNESSEVMRTKWKGLKDSYTKYQKQAEDSTGSKSTNCSRYHKWCWAEHLQFLDNCGKRKKSIRSYINTASLYDCSLDSEPPPSTQPVSTTNIPTTPPLETEIVFLEASETIPTDIVSEPRPPTCIQTTTAESSRLEESAQKRRLSSKRSYSTTSAEDGERIHLKRHKRAKPSEAIDLLFKSYAETFKSFSTKRQVSLKVKLAKLFADAEMDEMKESMVVYSSASVVGGHDYALGLELEETMKHSPASDRSSID